MLSLMKTLNTFLLPRLGSKMFRLLLILVVKLCYVTCRDELKNDYIVGSVESEHGGIVINIEMV
jgi:hypothetical protein